MCVSCYKFNCIYNSNKTPQNNLCGYCNKDSISITKTRRCEDFKENGFSL